MNISVTFRNMKPSEAVKEYATKKLEKIKKFLPDAEPIEVHVVLSVEKHRHIADVVVTAKDLTISAKEETEDIYSAIDLVADSVEKQAKKHRERVKTRKSNFKEVVQIKESMLQEEPSERPAVVRVEKIDMKPMTIDEAVMEVDSNPRGFVVFVNAENGKVCVLYRREDGNYGLYEVG